MSVGVKNIVLQGSLLHIYYRDGTEDKIDERVAVIHWKKHPKILHLISEVYKILGTYFLTENQNLDLLEDIDITELLRNLMQDEVN